MSLPKRRAPDTVQHGQRSSSLTSTPLIPEQFKEAFSLLDKDGDGCIGKDELGAMWTSLGTPKSDADLKAMMALLPNPLNFAAFFTAMTSMLTDLSSRDDLLGALATFDEGDSGKIDVDDLKESLMQGPDALSASQIDAVVQTYTRNGKFNYHAFVESIAGAA